MPCKSLESDKKMYSRPVISCASVICYKIRKIFSSQCSHIRCQKAQNLTQCSKYILFLVNIYPKKVFATKDAKNNFQRLFKEKTLGKKLQKTSFIVKRCDMSGCKKITHTGNMGPFLFEKNALKLCFKFEMCTEMSRVFVPINNSEILQVFLKMIADLQTNPCILCSSQI